MSIMNYDLKKITIKEAAEQLNVSVVSIHNWIKEGSLQKTNDFLTQKNIDDFRDNFLKNKKLSSRANKQYKESHNHDSLSKDIKKYLKSKNEPKAISIMPIMNGKLYFLLRIELSVSKRPPRISIALVLLLFMAE